MRPSKLPAVVQQRPLVGDRGRHVDARQAALHLAGREAARRRSRRHRRGPLVPRRRAHRPHPTIEPDPPARSIKPPSSNPPPISRRFHRVIVRTAENTAAIEIVSRAGAIGRSLGWIDAGSVRPDRRSCRCSSWRGAHTVVRHDRRRALRVARRRPARRDAGDPGRTARGHLRRNGRRAGRSRRRSSRCWSAASRAACSPTARSLRPCCAASPCLARDRCSGWSMRIEGFPPRLRGRTCTHTALWRAALSALVALVWLMVRSRLVTDKTTHRTLRRTPDGGRRTDSERSSVGARARFRRRARHRAGHDRRAA